MGLSLLRLCSYRRVAAEGMSDVSIPQSSSSVYDKHLTKEGHRYTCSLDVGSVDDGVWFWVKVWVEWLDCCYAATGAKVQRCYAPMHHQNPKNSSILSVATTNWRTSTIQRSELSKSDGSSWGLHDSRWRSWDVTSFSYGVKIVNCAWKSNEWVMDW